MDPIYFHLVCLLAYWRCGNSCTPLHLTPLIDQGDITTALELSQVRDALQVIPKSYAGFITTDRDRRNHLFFWFFPASSDAKAPLMVWLNGGPGISSMLGLFYENGPIRTKPLEDGHVGYEPRPRSWAEPFSMLYIDNPVGTGYSYSETNSFKTTQDGYSEELYLFMEQFYLMFPQYLERELYLGGQSYAGKYIPALAHRIHTKIGENKSAIPLTGIYLGGPLFDPLTQFPEVCDYYFSVGVISYYQLMTCQQKVSDVAAQVNAGPINNSYFDSVMSKIIYPYPRFVPFPPDNYATNVSPGYDNVNKVMVRSDIREAVHVCDLSYPTTHEYSEMFFSDIFVSTKSKLAVLMDNYKVLLFTGDLDGIITSPMVEAALMSTPWSLQGQYNISDRSVWKAGGQLKGFYTKTGQFCRVVVHGAGHQTPHDQPDSTLDMMVQFVNHGCILEHS